MKNRIKKPRYFVQALAKGLSVLQAFAEADHPLTSSEIADALGTSNSTSTRLCYTLTELGFIERDRQRRYKLTPKVLSLGYSFISGAAWRELAKNYLESLFKEVQETANLSMVEGSEIIYIIRIRKRKYLPYDIRIGTKLPVYCTAMGKVLMAMGPPEVVQPILKTLEFKALTARTITRLDKFLEELDEVRKKGYAIADEELSIGVRGIGAPILDKHGYAVAAINITVPTTEYSRSQMEKTLATKVMQVANQISAALLKMDAPFVTGIYLELKIAPQVKKSQAGKRLMVDS